MPSTVGWITGTFKERDDAAELLGADHEAEPRDMLGIGPLRDVLSRAFFPGITTQQTRAKYFIFVPAICAEVEASRPRQDPWSRIRGLESDLMEALRAGPDHSGVIGSQSWRLPGRPATGIYWTGLYEWGIRTRDVSLSWYRSWVSSGMRVAGAGLSEEQEPPADPMWHPRVENLRSALEKPKLQLTGYEARFLRQRILSIRPVGRSRFRPLIKDLQLAADNPQTSLDGDLWDLAPVVHDSAELAGVVKDAGCLSAAVEGAMYAYNGCLKAAAPGWRDRWTGEFVDWRQRHPREYWENWDVDAAIGRVQKLPAGSRALASTEYFLRSLVDALRTRTTLGDPPLSIEQLVTRRERDVKGPRAPTLRKEPLPDWELGGGIGIGRIQFRWGQAKGILKEISRRDGHAA